jgi:putative addiction module killer protein
MKDQPQFMIKIKMAEARIDHGPGYRVYFAQSGNRVVLLLLGGSKKTQQTDIKKAQSFWVDWEKGAQSEQDH